MKPPFEALSRLHAGELPDDEAEQLRRRIDTEPAVARAWAELVALVDGIAHLPESHAPPELDARVLGVAGGASAPTRRPLTARIAGAVALAAVAVAGIAVGWIAQRGSSGAEQPPRIAIVDGSQIVDGAIAVVAGDLPVQVDGVARITVTREPTDRLARAPGQEEPMDKRIAWAAGLGGGIAGALVTVAVYEGKATLDLGDGPVVVEAGDSRTIVPERRVVARAVVDDPSLTPEQRVAALQAENAALRAELEEAKFTGAVARGQVAATQGEPIAWTDDVPAAYRPDAFEATLRAEVGKVPGFKVDTVDCSEYPCIATIVAANAGPNWQDQAKGVAEAISDTLPDGAGTWLAMMAAEDDAGVTTGGIGMSFTPRGDKELGANDAVRTRVDFRGQSLLKDLEPHGGGGDGDAPGTRDVDVNQRGPGQTGR